MKLIEEEYHCFRCIRYERMRSFVRSVDYYAWYVRKAVDDYDGLYGCDKIVHICDEDSDEAYLGLMGYLRCF